jgi:hypothetical protein
MNNNEFSEFFTCGNGVRQIPILLPFLFSLYLNDLETFLEKNNVTDLRTLSDELEQELGLIMLKKNVIMYADDTALLAESASNLQNTLNLIQEYCIKWKLKVNIDKIKVDFFPREDCQQTFILSMGIRN